MTNLTAKSFSQVLLVMSRSSRSEVLLGKGVLKICSTFTGEHPCRSMISIKLQSNFGMGVLLQICCIFSEHLFLRTPLNGCFRPFFQNHHLMEKYLIIKEKVSWVISHRLQVKTVIKKSNNIHLTKPYSS